MVFLIEKRTRKMKECLTRDDKEMMNIIGRKAVISSIIKIFINFNLLNGILYRYDFK